MELTGHIAGISVNYLTQQFEVTFVVNESEKLAEGYEILKGEEVLSVKIAKYRKRRSRDANAYFHVLVSRLADRIKISKTKCKNIMIGRYGQPLMADEETEAVIKTNIPVEQMMENESIHCMPCGCRMENGQEIVFYKIFRGSSTYDSLEMSILIDGTVEECREQGIETLPPEELERMVRAWKA